MHLTKHDRGLCVCQKHCRGQQPGHRKTPTCSCEKDTKEFDPGSTAKEERKGRGGGGVGGGGASAAVLWYTSHTMSRDRLMEVVLSALCNRLIDGAEHTCSHA